MSNQNREPDMEIGRYSGMMDIPKLTGKIIRTFNMENIRIARKHTKTVGNLYTKLKDKVPPLAQSSVIYKLQCADCHKYYIGQTSTILKTRISGHKSDSKLNPHRCMLATHVNTENHRISYENVKILDIERNYTKRCFLEMYHIYKTEDTINKRSDIQDLSAVYTNILELNKYSQTREISLFEEAITF